MKTKGHKTLQQPLEGRKLQCNVLNTEGKLLHLGILYPHQPNYQPGVRVEERYFRQYKHLKIVTSDTLSSKLLRNAFHQNKGVNRERRRCEFRDHRL